jgi:DNA-binding GntR family transcriptional regulator
MSDRVRRILAERIRDGTYPPGTRLVELRLARELGTSQAPVREALRELAAAGLVESEPYRGTRVRTRSERELWEGCQVRAALEELAARLALPRLQDGLAELHATAEAVRAAAETGDLAACAREDLAFRRTIVAAAANQVLLRSWEAIACEEQIRLALSRWREGLASFAEDHRLVLEAFGRGEGRVAGALLRQGLESVLGPGGVPPRQPDARDEDARSELAGGPGVRRNGRGSPRANAM